MIERLEAEEASIVKARQRKLARLGLIVTAIIWMLIVVPSSVIAAPYAAMVMDARTGKVLHARNADTRLHPASLTKMMTLYVAFQAIERGEISLDTRVRISANAAAEPPSKLGLRAGQRIELRFLIRAAAIKSANDAATAIGEAISGSEAAFTRRMTQTARAMGMSRTTFKNAHGLTQSGHLSTARDMTILGRHIIYDYPQYYNLFSRTSTHAGIAEVRNTNRRLLAAYRGADGIKTGYTRAAGFNLVASAERGNERIIATMFGGNSSTSRNARVAELLDMGFNRAPTRAALRPPQKPRYVGNTVRAESSDGDAPTAGRIVRANGTVSRSLRPRLDPDRVQASTQIAQAAPETAPETAREQAAEAQTEQVAGLSPEVSLRPNIRPNDGASNNGANTARQSDQQSSQQVARAEPEPQPQVVTRLSTSGGRHWGVNIGRYSSRFHAEKALLQTALTEMSTLQGSLRRIVARDEGFDANFMGMTREGADQACRRLQARNINCFMLGPAS